MHEEALSIFYTKVHILLRCPRHAASLPQLTYTYHNEFFLSAYKNLKKIKTVAPLVHNIINPYLLPNQSSMHHQITRNENLTYPNSISLISRTSSPPSLDHQFCCVQTVHKTCVFNNMVFEGLRFEGKPYWLKTSGDAVSLLWEESSKMISTDGRTVETIPDPPRPSYYRRRESGQGH